MATSNKKIFKTKKSNVLTAICASTLLLSGYASADEHRKSHLSLDVDDIHALAIDAGAGSLSVEGIAGGNVIEVTAEIYAKNIDKTDIKLSLDKKGSKAVLTSHIENSYSSWGSNSPKINLTVKLPQELALKVSDGSGSIDIENLLSSVDIHDGSGSIEINNVQGSLEIHDGSGSISIKDVQGDVSIDDGSGSITAKHIEGNLDIDDGSGQITVKQVSGDVKLDDGSGSIYVDTVGSLDIIEAGSGGLTVENVKGDFNIDS